MAQKGRPTTFEERLEIGERWENGQSDPEIASAMERSVWTVRKWRRKYQREGRSGLVGNMGRPPTGALGQHPPETREEISAMREDHSNRKRTHQTVNQQAITGQSYLDSVGLEKNLSNRLDFLNDRYPSLALDG